jgi:hypothetical protein
MAVLSILLAVVVIAVLAAALLEVRRSLHASATGLATLSSTILPSTGARSSRP